MEAIIRTNDKNLFNSLLHFLKTIHVTVEMKKEKTASQKRLNPMAPVPDDKKIGIKINDFLSKGNYCSIGGDALLESEQIYDI